MITAREIDRIYLLSGFMLKAQRELNNVSQKAFALTCGWGQSRQSQLETHETIEIRESTMLRIKLACEQFGMELKVTK